MRVKQLAEQLNISPDTIRYYVRIGLLNPIKGENGYHAFTKADQKHLHFILSARDLGFTLEDIQLILLEVNQGKTPCPTVRQLIETRLCDAKSRLRSMQALVQRMESAVSRWAELPNCQPCREHICHLVEVEHELNSHTEKRGTS